MPETGGWEKKTAPLACRSSTIPCASWGAAAPGMVRLYVAANGRKATGSGNWPGQVWHRAIGAGHPGILSRNAASSAVQRQARVGSETNRTHTRNWLPERCRAGCAKSTHMVRPRTRRRAATRTPRHGHPWHCRPLIMQAPAATCQPGGPREGTAYATRGKVCAPSSVGCLGWAVERVARGAGRGASSSRGTLGARLPTPRAGRPVGGQRWRQGGGAATRGTAQQRVAFRP